MASNQLHKEDKDLMFNKHTTENIELYSFDIYDTIITRTVGTPKGIFALMQEKLIECSDFPKQFSSQFYKIRVDSEFFVKDYYKQTFGYEEISLDNIYEQIKKDYSFSDENIEYLKNLEIQTELDNTVGIEQNINLIINLIKQNKKVILISDMYLSSTILNGILSKIDRIFDFIKIYVSSEHKASKYSGELYKIIQTKEKLSYDKWKHFGDNTLSDIKQAKRLGIKAVKFDYPNLMPYEKKLAELYPNDTNIQRSIGISKLAQLNKIHKNKDKYDFGSTYSAPIFYSYVNEIINTALKRNFKTLYFIARDGYIPKIIADVIIDKKQLPIKTKYLYGSRLAWRIPDENNYEYFIDINFKEFQHEISVKLIAYRLGISIEMLSEYIGFKDKDKILTSKEREILKSEFINNSELRQTIIENYRQRRELLLGYLKQEIDFSENDLAFVEINGSGKTQVILSDNLNKIAPCSVHTFYLTVSPDIIRADLERIAFCEKPKPYSILPELLCRTDYGQTIGYETKNGQIVPKFEKYNKVAIQNWGYKEYLQGIIDYTNIAANSNLEYLPKELFYTYFDYVNNYCDSKTASILGDIPFKLVGKEDIPLKAAPKLSLLQIILCHLFNQNIMKFTQYPELSYARGNKLTNFYKNITKIVDNLFLSFAELKLYFILKKLKTKKVAFWGASIFLENFIKNWKINSENIVGIFDKNPNRQGQNLERYQIFLPEKIHEISPEYLIMTIKNGHKTIYKELSSTIQNKYPQVILLPDIFGK